jgi:cell division protein FtsI/penicillin-binding protein 2
MLGLAGLGVLLGGIVSVRSENVRPAAANLRGPGAGAEAQGVRAPASKRKAVTAARATGKQRELATRRLVGDAALKSALDLSAAALANGRYTVKLGDGRTAMLTLDPALQREAEALLARARAPMGAIVVMSVDGRILALAGRRSGNSAPQLATQVWAPAASIFKLITAAALVDAGVRPGAKVCYHGGVRSIVASNLVDHPRRDSACNDLSYAVARSQNALMAKLVHRHLEPARLRKVVEAFGISRAPAFALAAEPGRIHIPDDSLAFARVASGFWQTELSPLGGALIATTVASGGLAVTPRIVDRVVRGDVSIPIESPEARRVIAERVARQVADMMVGTTESGTAYKGFHDDKGRKFLPNTRVAGKTGTLTRRSPDYVQYSWFVGFAPADSPEIVVSVLFGNPERWYLKAHTAARIILQKAL